jgi:hypothetical protein
MPFDLDSRMVAMGLVFIGLLAVGLIGATVIDALSVMADRSKRGNKWYK